MMKKITRREFIPTALALGIGGALSLDHAMAAGPVKVRLGTLAPNGSSYCKHLQAMGEAWKKASGGNVSLTIYPDSTMGSEADMVKRMRLGQLHAAMLTVTGLAEIEPGAVGLQSMPAVFDSVEELDYIQEKLQPLLQQRIEKKGFVVLFWSDTGFVRFFSKREMIRPDDLKKTKLFVSAGRPQEEQIYRSVGCNPVPLEFVDIVPNLQTGLIDTVALPPSIALATQVDKIAPNMLELNWSPLVGGLIISRKAWDSIPADVQNALRESAKETGKKIKADGRRESSESVQAMCKRGLKVHPMTPEILADWRRVVGPEVPKLRGGAVPADIFDEVMKHLNEFRAAQGKK